MEAFQSDYSIFCPVHEKGDFVGSEGLLKSTVNKMELLKHCIWAVVRLTKIYSSNPIVKWIH